MYLAETKARYRSIDDFLGPADQRFFGDGFKRVRSAVTEIHVDRRDDGLGQVRGRAGVSYPTDWSKKSTATELRPHLSTVDALLLGTRLAEITLTHLHGLSEDQRRRAWIRRFECRAGTRPQEDLENFPVRASQVSHAAAPGTLCGHVSVLRCEIGAMKVRCEIEHPVGAGKPGMAYFASEEDVLGTAGRRYYAEGFTSRRQSIRDVTVEPELHEARATVDVCVPDGSNLVESDLGAYYQPAFSMLDCLTTSAQIAQVLLYHEDGLDRGRTNTLWLRKVTMETTTPYHALTPFDVAVLALRSERVPFAGETWRTSNMTSDFQGIRAWAALAHKLPEGVDNS
jgi:hypothetical protein